MHYYKFEIAVWHLHTSHLSLIEEAVYFRLINFYYDTESPIPTETHSVIRRLRLTEYSEIVVQILNEFFELHDDGWHQKHCDTKIIEYHAKGNTNKNNGNSKTKTTESFINNVLIKGSDKFKTDFTMNGDERVQPSMSKSFINF